MNPLDKAQEALETLVAGNKRFVEHLNGTTSVVPSVVPLSNSIVDLKPPHTIVIGCADSRVTPELVFNQQLGDLFTLRTAGNLVDNQQLATVELVLSKVNIPLLLVLGHTDCLAVKHTYQKIIHQSDAGEEQESNLTFLTSCIQPAIESTVKGMEGSDELESFEQLEIENVKYQMEQLVNRSATIMKRVDQKKLLIKEALYSTTTGKVKFI